MQKTKRKEIIDLSPIGMKGLHFYVEGLNFPVVVGTYSEWEETQVSYLSVNIKNESFNTETICRWCMNHHVQYRIIYPIDKKSVIMHPYKYYKFLQLKRNLQKMR